MTITERLQALRLWMKRRNLEAFIIPSNDPHFSEYVAPYWGCRGWISGFTGSAGTVIVTHSSAAMWTDSRYFLQAQEQLSGSGIELQKIGVPETPGMTQWLKSAGCTKVGIDGMLISKNGFDNDFGEIEIRATDDPFVEIWSDRPIFPSRSAMVLSENYAGESIQSKVGRIRDQIDGTLLVTALDDIAWTLNIRGQDVDYNPLVVSYMAIEPDGVKLFVDSSKFTEKDIKSLIDSGVEIVDYNNWEAYLALLGMRGEKVMVSPSRIDVQSWNTLIDAGASIVSENKAHGTISALKAIKNEVEIEGFRLAAREDGVATVRFQMWLEAVGSGSVTEIDVANKLLELRMKSPRAIGESFATIAGYGAHGAVVHYQANQATNAVIGDDNILLVDSGGQYLCGTTDITRVYHLGIPTDAHKRDYTNVLMGLIELSSAIFPVATRGTQLDVLARQFLWADSSNYMHGTGHGIGHFLCVHEGPQSIRMNENPVTLASGMIQSCEPAVYRASNHGVRIENMILARHHSPGYLCFETLTLAPIALHLIEVERLTTKQIKWLNDYHSSVYKSLSELLDPRERQWLAEKTSPIVPW